MTCDDSEPSIKEQRDHFQACLINGCFVFLYLADIRQLGKNLFFPSLALNHFPYYEKSVEIEIKL